MAVESTFCLGLPCSWDAITRLSSRNEMYTNILGLLRGSDFKGGYGGQMLLQLLPLSWRCCERDPAGWAVISEQELEDATTLMVELSSSSALPLLSQRSSPEVNCCPTYCCLVYATGFLSHGADPNPDTLLYHHSCGSDGKNCSNTCTHTLRVLTMGQKICQMLYMHYLLQSLQQACEVGLLSPSSSVRHPMGLIRSPPVVSSF